MRSNHEQVTIAGRRRVETPTAAPLQRENSIKPNDPRLPKQKLLTAAAVALAMIPLPAVIWMIAPQAWATIDPDLALAKAAMRWSSAVAPIEFCLFYLIVARRNASPISAFATLMSRAFITLLGVVALILVLLPLVYRLLRPLIDTVPGPWGLLGPIAVLAFIGWRHKGDAKW